LLTKEELNDKEVVILELLSKITPYNYTQLKGVYCGSIDKLLEAIEYSLEQNKSLKNSMLYVDSGYFLD